MNVESTVLLEAGHSIEFGRSTWNEEGLSVRNRYTTANGGFSPHSSSEIPIEDVAPIVLEVLRRDLLNPEIALLLIQEASDSVRRRISR